MSSFLQFLENEPVIIMEGAIIERLRRTPGITLDPVVLNSSLLYDPAGKKHLERLYRQYIDCAYRQNLPVMVLTPTWRANPERLARAGLQIYDVNGDGFHFLQDIRRTYGPYSEKIFIGGLMGCSGDAYKPEEALSAGTAYSFHREQVRLLVLAGVDFLFGSTLPALSEAFGMAQAMAGSGRPYILSFVVRPGGTLLDGTLLSDAIRDIDGTISPSPAGYMVNCVHPDIFRKAMGNQDRGQGEMRRRIIGLQANTSSRSPEELDGREELDAEEPAPFGEKMAALHIDFSLKILGGCCGTDERHMESIVCSIIV